MNSMKSSFFQSRRFALFLVCLVLAAALIPPAPAFAKESEEKVVRVGWYVSPFNMSDKFGRRSGYAYEYQQKIAAYTGWTYEYVEGTWPDLLAMLEKGEIDLLSDVSYTAERAEKMLFPSLPMGTEEYFLFVQPEAAAAVSENFENLNGKRIGLNKGSIQTELLRNWLTENEIKAEIVELTCTVEEAFEQLEKGEIDGYVTLDAYGTTGNAVPVTWMGSSDFFFAVNKDRTDLLKELDTALVRIQAENRFYSQQLLQKYVSSFGANVYLSSEESAWLAKHGTIRVGYQDNYLAYCAKNKDTGELTGVLKEYLDEAADCLKNAHLDFEPIAYPNIEAAILALENGEVDCVFPSNLSVYDGEELGIMMTPSIIHAEAYALVRKTVQSSISEKEHVSIAVEPFDINYHTVVRDLFPDWEMKEFPDTASCLRAVASGDADCYLTSNYQYNELEKELDKLGLKMVATGKVADFSIAVDRDNRELYSILTRTTSFITDTNMNAALTYYTAEAVRFTPADMLRENLALVIGVFIVLVALIQILLFQHRMIVAQREASERQRMVDDLNKQVFVDALTRARNKGGFDNYIKQLQEQMARNEVSEVAIGVLDCNGLKLINDQYGHEQGNTYLKISCSLICHTFKKSPVFRIGGDEFVVVFLNDDFRNREELIAEFQKAQEATASAENLWERVSIALGIAVYDPKTDESLHDTFRRADKIMYDNKRVQKEARRRN